MPDERVSAAARAAEADGSLEARARALLERARKGELSQDNLKLLALCGDDAALAAFGCRHDDYMDGDRACLCWYGASTKAFLNIVGTPARWAWCLRPLGPLVSLRAALGAGWLALPEWTDRHAASRGLEIEAIGPGEERRAVGASLLNVEGLDRYGLDSRPRRALEAASAYLNCPCDEHKDLAAVTLRCQATRASAPRWAGTLGGQDR